MSTIINNPSASSLTPRTDQQLPHFLQQVLPDNYTYILKSYKELELETFSGAPTAAFDSTFYVNITSNDAIEEWRVALRNKTGTRFCITKTGIATGRKVMYNRNFHCQQADIATIMYRKPYTRGKRITNCQTFAKIRLETCRLQLLHPCEIHLVYNHNHLLEIPIIPVTPSMGRSFRSDDNGKNKLQHNFDFDSSIFGASKFHNDSLPAKTLSEFQQFVKECEVDILKGDTEYCKGIIKFMENHRKAKSLSLSHATSFLNQFTWPEPTNIHQHDYETQNLENFANPQFITYTYHHQQQQFVSFPDGIASIAGEQFLLQRITTMSATNLTLV